MKEQSLEQPLMKEGYRECHLCAVENKMRARRCFYCTGNLGLRDRICLEIKQRSRRKRAPYLSAVVPGAGHWYTGRRYVGTFFMAMAPLAIGLAVATYTPWNWGLAVLSLGIFMVWVLALVDSRRGAHHFQAPCQVACPGKVPCSHYVHLAVEGKYRESLELVEAVCPFPGTIGRICHHPCETDCNRGKDGEPVAICALKRFVDDNTGGTNNFYRREIEAAPVSLGHKIAVIGAGPSGLTAALFLRILGFRVSVFDAGESGGGTPASFVPGYRLPPEVYRSEVERILDLDLDPNFGKAMGRDFSLKDLQEQGFSGVYLAIGAMRTIGLPHTGEEKEGFLDGRAFLKRIVRGDAVELPGEVLVIGGGNVAMDVARSAVRCGAGKVRIICLEKKPVPREKQFHYFKNEWREIRAKETGEVMPAWPWEIDDALEEKIEIIGGGSTSSFDFEGGRVARAICREIERIDTDDKGRLLPVLKEGPGFTLKADWVITAVGSTPDYSATGGRPAMKFLSDTIPIALLRKPEGCTVPVLAGGDYVRGPSSIIEGITAGREAAMYLYRRLMGEPEISIRYRNRRIMRPWSNYPDSLDKRQRRRQLLNKEARETKSFDEVYGGFTEMSAREEADRCMRCDWPLVRESKVKKFLGARGKD
ncbi:glutamate synthase [NADPH] small chain [bacterium BMS3Abin14]|nr:glutamate synthase [NADPH] small chain [bacterium BMS3Abin14]